MANLLQLDCSSSGCASISRQLTGVFAQNWTGRDSEHVITCRDLHADPIPHLPHASLHWPPHLRPSGSPVLPDAEARQQALIEELLAADVVLVAAPMYNYTIPSTLKTWVDHIHVPGLTAPFDGDTQPLRGRPAVIVSPRGAIYDDGSPTAGRDHAVPVLEIVLGTALGMRLETVTVSRTLSPSVPSLAGERERFEAEYEAGRARLAELARIL